MVLFFLFCEFVFLWFWPKSLFSFKLFLWFYYYYYYHHHQYHHHGDRDGVVGVATRYGLGGLRIKSRWRQGVPYPSTPVLGPTQPPIKWVPGLFPRGYGDRGVWRKGDNFLWHISVRDRLLLRLLSQCYSEIKKNTAKWAWDVLTVKKRINEIKDKFYIHGSVHREANWISVQKDETVFSVLHFCRQLYMFQVLTAIRSWCSCNYSFWYWLTAYQKL